MEGHPQHSLPVVGSSEVSVGTFEEGEIAGVPVVADLGEEVVEDQDAASRLEIVGGVEVGDALEAAAVLADPGVTASSDVERDLAARPIYPSPPPSSSSSPCPHKNPCDPDLPKYPARS